MKRDLELIRKMTLLIVDDPEAFAPHPLGIEGYTDGQIGYHAYLMIDAGLAVGTNMTCIGADGPNYRITHLTSAGHNFADKARPQFIWDEAMDALKQLGFKSASVGMAKKLLDRTIRKHLDDIAS